jgi:hypothetical protein
MKRFSVDDLRNHLPQHFNNNVNNLHGSGRGYFPGGRNNNQYAYNIINDGCGSDYNSHHSGTPSNYSSASPTKRFVNNPNVNFTQLMGCQPVQYLPFTNNNMNTNQIFNDSRRNSMDFNHQGMFNLNHTRSQRGSQDFSNVVYPGFPFNNFNTNNIPNNVCNNPILNNNICGLNNNIVLDDKYILENILVLLKDQNGCRLIQKKIEERGSEFIYPIFEKIQNNLNELILDQFGNYVIQKVIDYIYSDKAFVATFFEKIKSNSFLISINQYGTRVLQRLLDYFVVNYPENQSTNDVMKDLILSHTYELIMDTNGNHVFQKILMIYPKGDNQFIFDELAKVGIEIAKSKKGGCIFQRAFDHASPNQKVKLEKLIFRKILSACY